jgi:hypothetical protein
MPDKDPAAVTLGRKRQANVTPIERSAFGRLGAEAAREANAARTRDERKRISRKAARTRRLSPRWVYQPAAGSPGEPPPAAAPAGELAELAGALDTIEDAVLEELYAALERLQNG